jgi:hypothetical protein
LSLPDFQLAFARLIASPRLCVETIANENNFFAAYELSDKEKRRLHAVLRQKGISACCSLYRMNRVTPVYSQLSNTCTILGDDLIPVIEAFWNQLTAPSLQFKEEVLGFGHFLMDKIDRGLIAKSYLKEILQLEMTMNEISYLPQGEFRIVSFQYDIHEILNALAAGNLHEQNLPPFPVVYKLYMHNLEMKMDLL